MRVRERDKSNCKQKNNKEIHQDGSIQSKHILQLLSEKEEKKSSLIY